MQGNIQLQLAKLRRTKKITQQELAEYVGTTYQTISKWENGVTMPDITVLPVLASYFQVSVDELLGLVPLRGEEFLPEETDSEEFWNRRLEYLQSSRRESWNRDYLQFLIEKVWKLHEPVSVLDCGCGYGYMGCLLMPLLPEGSDYTGIDFAETLVEQGKKMLQRNQVAGEIWQGDFLSMEETKHYDVVLCQSVLRHLGDSKPFIKKMLRMAKKGGLLVCIDSNRELECSGLYVEGMDYGFLCEHKGLIKHWQTEYENGSRDYAAAMRNAYVMQDLGVKNVQVRMNDRVSFVTPQEEDYSNRKENFLQSNSTWYHEENEAVVERLVNHGMTREEAEAHCQREKVIEQYVETHEKVRYTQCKGKMITFGYKE
ncbi:MAG: methyltransferase domain-containing protein [Lachnospiraceae bacterium]|nr:methyltransferase domain-containing protein [Lachnospiraceae bacterium]